jgi:glutathione S-transferase
MSHELVLYKFDACPFCYGVQSWLDGRDIPVVYRDTREDPSARQELFEATSRTQVPCLFIDGQPLFESDAILEWLAETYETNSDSGSTSRPSTPDSGKSVSRRSRILKKLRGF